MANGTIFATYTYISIFALHSIRHESYMCKVCCTVGEGYIRLEATHNTFRQTRSKFITGHDIMMQTISVPTWPHTDDWEEEKFPYHDFTSLLNGRVSPTPRGRLLFLQIAETAGSIHTSTPWATLKEPPFQCNRSISR